MTSYNSPASSLLWVLSSCMDVCVEAVDTSTDAEEVAQSGVDAAWTEVDNSFRAPLAMHSYQQSSGSSISRNIVSTGDHRLRPQQWLNSVDMVTTDADKFSEMREKSIFAISRALFRRPSFFLS